MDTKIQDSSWWYNSSYKSTEVFEAQRITIDTTTIQDADVVLSEYKLPLEGQPSLYQWRGYVEAEFPCALFQRLASNEVWTLICNNRTLTCKTYEIRWPEVSAERRIVHFYTDPVSTEHFK